MGLIIHEPEQAKRFDALASENIRLRIAINHIGSICKETDCDNAFSDMHAVQAIVKNCDNATKRT